MGHLRRMKSEQRFDVSCLKMAPLSDQLARSSLGHLHQAIEQTPFGGHQRVRGGLDGPAAAAEGGAVEERDHGETRGRRSSFFVRGES